MVPTSDIMRGVAEKAKPERGQLALLAILAGFFVLAALPDDHGAVRLAGVSLLWWYGGLAGPVLAVAAAVLSAGRGSSAKRAGAPPPPPH
jgi:uncharacterized membrane protein YbhN (UPF0104 family)